MPDPTPTPDAEAATWPKRVTVLQRIAAGCWLNKGESIIGAQKINDTLYVFVALVTDD